MLRVIFSVVAAILWLPASAQDAGLIGALSGTARVVGADGSSITAKSFMKLRENDRVELSRDSEAHLVFFGSSSEERWKGPASLRVTPKGSAPVSGAPSAVLKLPEKVAPQLTALPERVQLANLAGVQVRGVKPARVPTEEEKKALADARATYQRMNAELPPDDITPELYLYSALAQYELRDEMQALAAAMRRKQPANAEVLALDRALKKR
ncbi:MAG TPA: hypothetical protein VI321_10155 [Burkholderiales bacterium]